MRIYNFHTKNALSQTVSCVAIIMMYGFDVRTFFGGFLPINLITSILIVLFLYPFCYIVYNPEYPRNQRCMTIDVLIFFFLFFYGIRLLWNIYIDGYEQQIFNNNITCYIYLIFLCAIPYITIRNIAWDIIDISYILRILIFLFLAGLLFSFKAFLSDLVAGVEHYQGRAEANEYLDTIGYGHLALTFVLACYSYLKIKKNNNGRWIYYCFIVFGVLSIGLANSRSPILALLIIIGIMVIQRVSIIKIIASILIILTIIYNIENLNEFFVERFNSPFIERTMMIFEVGMSDASNGRDALFSSGLEMFKNNPVVGHSIVLTEGGFRGSYVHNAVIEVLMGLGIIGGILYFFINYIAFFASYYLIKNNSKYIFFSFVFIQHFIFLQFSRSLLLLPLYWVSIASVYSCYILEKKKV